MGRVGRNTKMAENNKGEGGWRVGGGFEGKDFEVNSTQNSIPT